MLPPCSYDVHEIEVRRSLQEQNESIKLAILHTMEDRNQQRTAGMYK